MLRFRPFKECDAPVIAGWIRDEYSFRLWCADRFEKYPLTAADLIGHYDGFADSDSFFQFTAYDEKGVAGHMIMRFTDSEKKTVRFGFVIVDYDRRGTGLGKEMMLIAEKYAFEFLGAEKITLGVFENNPAAYHCYRAAGFHEVKTENTETYGVFGETWKCIEMELERPE
ncbi:MAG: GNAT family N-acetyltransferase [Ruminococcus sp.]|nr:GNAT family N-acetyltransferase [Ruminococcus sp.]